MNFNLINHLTIVELEFYAECAEIEGLELDQWIAIKDEI